MTDFEIYGKCATCKQNKFFIRKRQVPLPVGVNATSKKKLCTHCYKGLLKLMANNAKI